MSTIMLALTLSITNGVITIRCVTPGPGSYSVQCSQDLHAWKVMACGYVEGVAHITAKGDTGGECNFYRVEWREKGK